MKNIIGSKVKEARNNQTPKITQADLAARLQLQGWQIDRSGVAKIEIGLRSVTDIEVKRLAEALDVSIAWLFGETHDYR
jgi:transcriptional regulator with XRE-family HTH domain